MKRKINLDRKEISSEEISKGKDFQSVLDKFKTVPASVPKPFYRKWGFLAGSVATVAIVTTLIVTNPFGETKDVTSGWDYNTPAEFGGFTKVSDADFTYNQKKAFIAPPFDYLDPEFEKYRMKGEKGVEILTNKGSKVKIQRDALLGEDGKPVKGEVEVKVREFHDPVDLFLSGIPMGYDSGAVHYDFETAGMIEVYAFQGGKVLKIDPAKKVTIELKTNSADTKFNVYELDTAGKNWEYKGKDRVKEIKVQLQDPVQNLLVQEQDNTFMTEKLIEISNIKEEIKSIEIQKPLEPKKAKAELHSFNFDVNKAEFPEIAVYKDVLWEVGVENKDFNDAMYKITWEDALIKEGKERGQYIVLLKKGETKKQWTVYPVFEGKDYDAAKTIFDSKFSEYETKLNTKKQEEKGKQDEYQKLLKKARDEQNQQTFQLQEKMTEQQKKQQEMFALRGNVMREFTIENFGVWNCDNPHLNNSNVMNAILYNEKGVKMDMINICIVNLRFNGIVSGWIAPKALLSTKYAAGKNLMWTISDDKKLLVCDKDAFEDGVRKKSSQGFQQFTLKETNVDVTSSDDIKKYLFGTLALK